MVKMKTALVVATRVTRPHVGEKILMDSWCMKLPRASLSLQVRVHIYNATPDKKINSSNVNCHSYDKKKMSDGGGQTVK